MSDFDTKEDLNFVTIKDLSNELGVDRSNLRKYILSQGIEPLSVRTAESRGQITLAFTADDAQFIREKRKRQGFSFDKPIPSHEHNGIFYVIQIIPEFEPNRIKLGYSSDIQSRLQSHKTSAPTAILVKSWPCKRTWEDVVITSATRMGCKLIANEVFLCDDVEILCGRIDDFFAQLPALNFKIEQYNKNG